MCAVVVSDRRLPQSPAARRSICPPTNCGQSREGVIFAVDDGGTRRSLKRDERQGLLVEEATSLMAKGRFR